MCEYRQKILWYVVHKCSICTRGSRHTRPEALTKTVYPQTSPSRTVWKDASLIPPFDSPSLPLPVSMTQAPPTLTLVPLLTAADHSGNADAGLWLKIYQTLWWRRLSRCTTYQMPLRKNCQTKASVMLLSWRFVHAELYFDPVCRQNPWTDRFRLTLHRKSQRVFGESSGSENDFLIFLVCANSFPSTWLLMCVYC